MQEQSIKYFDPENPKIKQRIKARNHLDFSFLALMPISTSHSLICPVRLVDSTEQITLEEWQAFFELKLRAC